MGGPTAWSVHKEFFYVNVSVVTEPAKDMNTQKTYFFKSVETQSVINETNYTN